MKIDNCDKIRYISSTIFYYRIKREIFIFRSNRSTIYEFVHLRNFQKRNETFRFFFQLGIPLRNLTFQIIILNKLTRTCFQQRFQ